MSTEREEVFIEEFESWAHRHNWFCTGVRKEGTWVYQSWVAPTGTCLAIAYDSMDKNRMISGYSKGKEESN